MGNSDKYGYGGKKIAEINYSYKGIDYTDLIEFEIIDKDHDKLSTNIQNYNNNTGLAGLTFRGKLSARTVMNSGGKDWNGNLGLDGGGWAKSDMRAWLNGDDFFGNLPYDLKAVIKEV
jgi:hypothetical protein